MVFTRKDGGFSMAMLVYRRVYATLKISEGDKNIKGWQRLDFWDVILFQCILSIRWTKSSTSSDGLKHGNLWGHLK